MKTSKTSFRIGFLFLIVFLQSFLISCSSSSGSVASLDGAFTWVSTWGGVNYDSVIDSTSDSDGNIFVTGIFKGEMDADPGTGIKTLTAIGSSENAFIIKFGKDGSYKWAISLNVTPAKLATDSSNNVLLTGTFSETVDFEPDNTANGNAIPTGVCDGFVLKLNSKGEFIYHDTFHGATNDSEVYPTDIKINSNGETLICGHFVKQLVFINTLKCDTDTNCFLVKYSGLMTRSWDVCWGSTESETCDAMILSSLDDIYLTGSFKGTVDFDPGVNQANKTSKNIDGYILKLDGNRQFYWVYTWGGATGTVKPYSIDIDSSMSVYVSGSYKQDIAFNSGMIAVIDSSINNSEDCFFLSVDFNGNYKTHNVWGGQNTDIAYTIKCDCNGNILVGGSYQLIVDFNPSSETFERRSEGVDDAFLVKYDSSHTFKTGVTFGAQLNDKVQSILCLDDNNQYVFGSFQRTVDFDTSDKEKNVSVIGHVDCFMLKINLENFQ